jgi:hypothetical protein
MSVLRYVALATAMVSVGTIAGPPVRAQVPTVREAQRSLEIRWQFDTGG